MTGTSLGSESNRHVALHVKRLCRSEEGALRWLALASIPGRLAGELAGRDGQAAGPSSKRRITACIRQRTRLGSQLRVCLRLCGRHHAHGDAPMMQRRAQGSADWRMRMARLVRLHCEQSIFISNKSRSPDLGLLSSPSLPLRCSQPSCLPQRIPASRRDLAVLPTSTLLFWSFSSLQIDSSAGQSLARIIQVSGRIEANTMASWAIARRWASHCR